MIVKNRLKIKRTVPFKLTVDCYDEVVIDVADTLLTYIIMNNKYITYGDLSNRMKNPINPRNLDRPLGIISNACKENGLPLVSVMVVNKDDMFPGPGFFKSFYPGLKRDEWEACFVDMYQKVTKFKHWNDVRKAFCGD